MADMTVQEATEEFKILLDSDYYKKDRSVNSAEDYSAYKENRDKEAAIEYANSEEFKELCVREGLISE